MDEFTHGGTPPSLWLDRNYHQHITHYMDCSCSSNQYELRIRRLADQVEKLSWMLELMDQEPGINLEMAEYQWQYVYANLRLDLSLRSSTPYPLVTGTSRESRRRRARQSRCSASNVRVGMS